MKQYYKFTFSDLSLGIILSLFCISIATIFVINFRTLYYFDINYLDIVKESGYPKNIILENYNALISWCSPLKSGSLTLPNFPQSQNAITHFNEVKRIFNTLYVIAGSGLVLFIAIAIKRTKSNPHYLLTSSIVVTAIPLIVGICSLINFSALFEIFHSIFFRNDYWLFDPETDPIILILPEEYFMHCAIFIILFQFLFSAILFLIYRQIYKKNVLYKN